MFPYRAVVEWSQEDECFVARAPAFEVLAAHGDTPEAAIHELHVAGEATVALMRETGRPVPEPDADVADFGGKVALRVPRSMHARVARVAQLEDVSVNQLLVSIIAEGLGRRAVVRALENQEGAAAVKKARKERAASPGKRSRRRPRSASAASPDLKLRRPRP
jgi:antitoxin HicB